MRHILLGLGMVVTLSACGDPLRNVARLSDVSAVNRAATVTQTPAEADNMGGGLFSRLLDRQPQDPTNAVVQAALSETKSPTAAARTASPASEQRGLFGLFRGRSNGARRRGLDLETVAAGAVLPFGQIARVCGLRTNALGTQIDAGGGYKIYDTIPNTTASRPFYVTGFNDNCARTFTGAVVVTGDVQTHEFVRYRPSNERIAYSTTDNAYEALKASVCRVGRGQPCGPDTQQLNADTHFITVYNFFGGTFSAVPTQWAQILMHDGDVLAMSIKNGQ